MRFASYFIIIIFCFLFLFLFVMMMFRTAMQYPKTTYQRINRICVMCMSVRSYGSAVSVILFSFGF